MKVLVQDITSAVAKITELVNGDKTVTGVLLKCCGDKLKVCYSDGNRSLIEIIDVVEEDGDIKDDIVLDYSRLCGALNNCQPSGRIVVDYIGIKFTGERTVEIHAEQKCLVSEEDSDNPEYRVMAVKKMALNWTKASDSLKTAILGRIDYDNILNTHVSDEWEIEELVEVLSKTSTEKGRVVYMSPSIQKVFVANIAHVTAVPVSEVEVTPMDIEVLRKELEESGEIEQFEERKSKLYHRMNFPGTITTAIAKKVCGILNKCGKGLKVYTHTANGFLTIVVEGETVGIMVDMPQGSKAQTGQFEKFSSIEYSSYQLDFVREFLSDAIKSAVASTNSEKLMLTFKVGDSGEAVLVIRASNGTASVNDEYKVTAADCIDTLGDLDGRQIKVSIKVINDMINQLKEDIVAMDIQMYDDGTVCIRLADIDNDRLREEYYNAREKLGLSDIDPTPDEEKVKYRAKVLRTTQYNIAGRE